ncbi:MAG: chloride channel protein [Proteobacteria bacterium]|nr:chloride channel protein [Pseudomonadota bacterium]
MSPRERAPLATLGSLLRNPGQLLWPWRSLDLRRLWRVLLHSLIVGAMAGSVACLFFYALEWAEWLVTGELARFSAPRPGGELDVTPAHTQSGPTRWWLVALLPCLGGLVCGWLVESFAPEARGPGGDAYIDAVHNKKGLIRARVPPLKALASLVTISTGGSAGREGPVMQTCAGIGSLVSRFMKLNEQERRILVVAGAAAGTGAIFRTPLGAALYAVEVLYRDDFESDAIVPCILASVTGYSIFTAVFGQGHLFSTDAAYVFLPAALPLFAVMAIGLSIYALAFVTFKGFMQRQVFARLRLVPMWARPAFGGALVGLLGLLVPQALGTGYGWLQGAIDGADWLGERGYWLLWGLAGAKILATSFTIGSGGSGGEFGPSLVIGGLAGGGFGYLFHALAPTLVPQPGAFALVGMAAMFGGAAHVPISSLIMSCEMAGSYDLLVPLMLAEGITFVLCRRIAIFPKQVPGRAHSPAHRDEGFVDILEALRVRDVYSDGEQLMAVRPGDSLHTVMHAMSEAQHPGVIVAGDDGGVAGFISLDTLQGAITEEGLDGLLLAADVMHRTRDRDQVTLDDDLHHVLHAFLVTGMHVLPVIDTSGGGRREAGVVTQAAITRAYESALVSRMKSAAEDRRWANNPEEPVGPSGL